MVNSTDRAAMASNRVDDSIKYNRDEILGKGAYAFVFKGTFHGRQVAVKRVQLLDINEDNEREMLAMKKLNHQNVVQLYHAHKDGEFK